MNDNQFYSVHKNYGKNALEWRRKFIGMLPEAYERRIHEKKGYGSIFEYAAKICGLNEKQVRRVLNLEKKFENTPALKALLVSGKVSANKLERVVSVATVENQEELAGKVKILSQRAVETLVRDEKFMQGEGKFEMQSGLLKPKIKVKSVHVHTFGGKEEDDKNSLKLSKEVAKKLFELQEKGHDVNEILLELLEKREEEIQEEKDQIAQELQNLPVKSSRKVPVRTIKILKKEFGCKCAVPGCEKLSEVFHHTGRFALTKQHNPHFMAPLCKAHHEIAHSIDLKAHQNRNFSTSSSIPN